VGHHCIRSGGAHGPQDEVASRIEPLFQRHGVDLYVSGHDHDLQLLCTESGWLQLVSGAGSCLRNAGWTQDTLFAEAKPGFVSLLITSEELRIEFFATTEGLVHAHAVRKTSARAGAELEPMVRNS